MKFINRKFRVTGGTYSYHWVLNSWDREYDVSRRKRRYKAIELLVWSGKISGNKNMTGHVGSASCSKVEMSPISKWNKSEVTPGADSASSLPCDVVRSLNRLPCTRVCDVAAITLVVSGISRVYTADKSVCLLVSPWTYKSVCLSIRAFGLSTVKVIIACFH